MQRARPGLGAQVRGRIKDDREEEQEREDERSGCRQSVCVCVCVCVAGADPSTPYFNIEGGTDPPWGHHCVMSPPRGNERVFEVLLDI